METIKNMRHRLHWVIAMMIIITILVIFISLFVGRYSIGINEFKDILFSLFNKNKEIVDDQTLRVLWRIRFPRIIGSVIVGAALAVSGATFQALFKNPMASSNVLGVNQGAAFGAAFSLMNFFPNKIVIVIAFLTGLFAVALTYFISSRFRMEQTLGLVLSGMVVGAVFQAGVSFLKLVADPENVLPAITYWLMGSLSDMSWTHLQTVFLPIIFGFILIFLVRKQLNLLTLGEDKAHTLGVNLKRTKIFAIIGATLLTSSSVALSGMIGWISLVVPHMCRFIVGPDYRYLIPCSAFVGIAFLVVIDTVARTLTQTEIPLGILSAIIGAPLFVLLIYKRKGK